MIKDKLALLHKQEKLEPVTATLPNGTKLFMERIECTSHYLSHLRKVIYDVAFKNLYYHNLKVPEDCMAVGDTLLRVEEVASIEFPQDFLAILNKPKGKCRGTKFYLDEFLYLDNVNFLRADSIRDNILLQRCNGTMIFDILKIVDPSGNTTEFIASPAVQKRMAEAKEVGRINMMIKS
ncbi:MAG TPA: hypothetical protein VFD03_03760 [Clostridia bacterium]|nr:hypothetical protein [Clostridia bacterium]